LKAEYLNAERRWLTLARSYGFSESLEDFTSMHSDWRRALDERLRAWSERVAKLRKNLDGPEDILQLHAISTLLIQEGDLEGLYSRILDAAMILMSSDMASMQSLDPERNQLRLLAWKGFHPQSAAFWEWVYLDSASTCGLALSAGCRVEVADVETCDFMAGTADLDEYRRSDIRAVQSTPLISRSGQLLGMISTHWREPHQPAERTFKRLDLLARQAADLIERSTTETTLRQRNEQLLQLASVIESSVDSIVTEDLDGVITSWNRSAQQLFGYVAEEVVGKPIAILIPLERHGEERAILERVRRGERIEHYETVRQRKDGGLIDISLTVSPVKNAEGRIIGASKIGRDITERKRKDEHAAMLAHEAEHRTKNVLATVQATIHLSHADTLDGLKDTIQSRIGALAKVHALFVQSRWAGADLSSIVEQELAPYLQAGEARARIDGPYLLMPPSTAQTVAVIVHELSTNAAKHGPLTAPGGQVEVKWRPVADGRFILDWIETGGPPAVEPASNGFGLSIIDRLIGGLGGKIHRDWRAKGLACQIGLQV
jgi:PAS domain S-box-containing protein